MAASVLTDCRLYVGSNDLSGDVNSLAVEVGADLLDATTFGHGTRINRAGIRSVVASAEGLWDADGADAPDTVLHTMVGLQDVPVTICPTNGADGERAFLFRAVNGEYGPSAGYGELLGFSVSLEGSDGAPLVRGLVLRAAGLVGVSGVGTGRNLGAVGATQRLYGALHVLSGSGTTPTLDVRVESAPLADFVGATTRLTFAQATGATSDWRSLAGPVSDPWYRVSYTIGGTAPSFSFVVAVGIA